MSTLEVVLNKFDHLLVLATFGDEINFDGMNEISKLKHVLDYNSLFICNNLTCLDLIWDQTFMQFR